MKVEFELAAAIIALLAVVVGGMALFRRRARKARDSAPIPLIIMPHGTTSTIPSRPAFPEEMPVRRPLRREPVRDIVRGVEREGSHGPQPQHHGTNGTTPPFGTDALTPARGGETLDAPRRESVVRYAVPADGTLQFLPGRLEIVSGRDDGREIRFVRTAGPDANVVTFGRAEGAAYRHVQLSEPTVSRSHAQMRYDGKGWLLANLSQTNPVMLNGNEVDVAADPVVLRDGDRIEMGEVIFRFHER
jgi:FHA domain-containing protein